MGRLARYNLDAGNSNILINSPGHDESNTLRIGRGTGTGTRQLNRAFIHGIAESTLTSGTAVFVHEVTSELGTRSCGLYVAAAVCPIAGASPNGPKCNAVPAGSFCEGDGECGTSQGLDNCGTGDWYIRTQ
ncbi:MAG TPA: hypothetical protein VNB06_12350 [Thermoanaerobaculia bacterium]|nr:hypothetical protein [Thermoanaerobaculia bacterium]